MGLLRGIARTAAIAGTATAVSNRVSRRQANRWAAKDQQTEEAAQYEQQQYQQPPQQYAPPPQQYAQPQYAQPQYAQPQYAPPAEAPAAPPAPEPLSTDDMLEQLKKLGELKEAGVLTDAEFQASKAKILGS